MSGPWRGYWLGFIAGLAFGGVVLMGAKLAHGEPPANVDPNSATAQWYRSLIRPDTGTSCCSIADCRPTEARVGVDGWEAVMDDKWVRIPQGKVLQHTVNIEGRAVLCHSGPTIYCFEPPAGV